MKGVFKKWWFWVLILIILLFLSFFFFLMYTNPKIPFYSILGAMLLYSFLAIPLLIIVSCFIGFVYMLIKYRKQVIKKWWFWVLVVMHLIFLNSSLTITSSFSGIVYDAITEEPIENILIHYDFSLNQFGMGHGTTRHVKKELVTDKNGIYKIPSKIILNLPLYERYGGDERIEFNTVLQKQPGKNIEEQNNSYYYEAHNFKRKLKDYMESYNKDGRGIRYHKHSFFRKYKNLDIMLIPKLTDIEDCNKISEEKIKNKCYKLNDGLIPIVYNLGECDKLSSEIIKDLCYSFNAYDLGILTGNDTICDYVDAVWDGHWGGDISKKEYCYSKANEIKVGGMEWREGRQRNKIIYNFELDESICMGLGEYGKLHIIARIVYERNLCFTRVALEKKDVNICENILNQVDKEICYDIVKFN